jgi:hypothetical protein
MSTGIELFKRVTSDIYHGVRGAIQKDQPQQATQAELERRVEAGKKVLETSRVQRATMSAGSIQRAKAARKANIENQLLTSVAVSDRGREHLHRIAAIYEREFMPTIVTSADYGSREEVERAEKLVKIIEEAKRAEQQAPTLPQFFEGFTITPAGQQPADPSFWDRLKMSAGSSLIPSVTLDKNEGGIGLDDKILLGLGLVALIYFLKDSK